MPIVEPEVLMDGEHDIDRCYEVTEFVLQGPSSRNSTTSGVVLEGMVLKPNMVIAGKKCRKQASRRGGRGEDRQGAQALRAGRGAGHRLPLRRPVGRGSDRASRRHEQDRRPALEAHLLLRPRAAGRAAEGLGGKRRTSRPRSAPSAHRAKMNGLAALGKWKRDLEKKAAWSGTGTKPAVRGAFSPPFPRFGRAARLREALLLLTRFCFRAPRVARLPALRGGTACAGRGEQFLQRSELFPTLLWRARGKSGQRSIRRHDDNLAHRADHQSCLAPIAGLPGFP